LVPFGDTNQSASGLHFICVLCDEWTNDFFPSIAKKDPAVQPSGQRTRLCVTRFSSFIKIASKSPSTLTGENWFHAKFTVFALLMQEFSRAIFYAGQSSRSARRLFVLTRKLHLRLTLRAISLIGSSGGNSAREITSSSSKQNFSFVESFPVRIARRDFLPIKHLRFGRAWSKLANSPLKPDCRNCKLYFPCRHHRKRSAYAH